MKKTATLNGIVPVSVLLAGALLATPAGPLFGQTWSATQRTSGGFSKERAQLLLDNSQDTLHYVWKGWDATVNLQIFTSSLDLSTGTWATPVQRTASLDYSINPQFVLDSANNKIYYVYQEAVVYPGPVTYYDIFTAEMNTDGTGWSSTQRTATSTDSTNPQLVLDSANGKIYYVYQETDTSNYEQLWTAELDLSTAAWSPIRRTFVSFDNTAPQLALDESSALIHYVFTRDDGSGYSQVMTASLGLSGVWNTPVQRTSGNFYCEDPQLVIDPSQNVIHYVYSRTDGLANPQIWTAELDLDTDTWSPTQRTSNNALNRDPQLALDNSTRTIYYTFDAYDLSTLRWNIWTAELDLNADIWSATQRTTSAQASTYPQLILDPSRYAIRYVYQEEDALVLTQIWTATLQYPIPTPTPSPTPTPTPTSAAAEYVVVSNGGTSGIPGRTLSVIDPVANAVVREVDCAYGGAVGWRPKDMALAGGTLYVVCNDAGRVFYGPVGGPMEGYIDVGPEPLGIALSPAGARAYVTCAGTDPSRQGSGSVSVIDLAARRTIAQVAVGRYPTYGIKAVDGFVGLTSLLDDTLSVYDSGNGRLLGRAGTGSKSYPLGLETAHGRNGRLFWGAALFGDGRTDAIDVYDGFTGRRVWRGPVAEGVSGGGPVALRLSSRGLAAVSLFMGDRVGFYSAATGRRLGEVSLARPGMGDFSPDGRYFYVPSFRGSVHVIDTNNFGTAAIIPVGPNPVRALYAAGVPPLSARSDGAPPPSPRSLAPFSSKSQEASFDEFLGGI